MTDGSVADLLGVLTLQQGFSWEMFDSPEFAQIMRAILDTDNKDRGHILLKQFANLDRIVKETFGKAVQLPTPGSEAHQIVTAQLDNYDYTKDAMFQVQRNLHYVEWHFQNTIADLRVLEAGAKAISEMVERLDADRLRDQFKLRKDEGDQALPLRGTDEEVTALGHDWGASSSNPLSLSFCFSSAPRQFRRTVQVR